MVLDLDRLFKVLVIGGAVMGCSDESVVIDGGENPPQDGNVVDTSAADTSAVDTSVATGDAESPDGNALCFCPADCCEAGEPKAGIECCWSTSC